MAAYLESNFGISTHVNRRQLRIMSEPKRQRNQEVWFVFSGLGTIVKSVTKNTTCNDVIKKLPQQPVRIAVYESVNGVERELSGKTRLLKVVRTHGLTSDVRFVIKESGGRARNRCSKRKLFSGLYQKSKLESFARRLSHRKSKHESHLNKSELKVRLNSSMDSNDNVISPSDVETMYHLLKADGITHRNKLSSTTIVQSLTTLPISLSRLDKRAVDESLHTMKLGFRKDLTSNESLHSRTIDRSEPTKRKAVHDSSTLDTPRHSTPVIGASGQPCKRSRLQLPATPTVIKRTSRNYRTSNRYTRRTVLADGFAEDEILASTMRFDTLRDTSNRDRVPAFINQADRCRYVWNLNSSQDSDSSFDSDCDTSGDGDTSGVDSQLDVAFWDPANTKTTDKAIETLTDRFDHSFDSMFSNDMTDGQTFDYGYSSDESSVEDDATPYSHYYGNTVSSFMTSTSGSRCRAGLSDCWSDGERGEGDSDEGIGSMNSGSVSSFRGRLLSLM